MCTFVTDRRPGENDILAGINSLPLLIVSLDGGFIERIDAPVSGWTHELLVHAGEELAKREVLAEGADAFLGEHWVGSTEV